MDSRCSVPNRKLLLAVCAVLFTAGACSSVGGDPGPTQTASEDIELGNATAARAEIHMKAGELRIEGGASNLMSASFRYSERVGRPDVHYEIAGGTGTLRVESPHDSYSGGHAVNEWKLRMGAEAPVDMTVGLGAGDSDLDLSHLQMRSLEVNMGAGEMTLNMSGKYPRDVTARVNGGVGTAKIRLPKETGVVVDATGGIGSIDTHGLTKRDGKYYNDAYADDKPALRMTVRGGVGDVTLSVGE